jgi:hypothetical protein
VVGHVQPAQAAAAALLLRQQLVQPALFEEVGSAYLHLFSGYSAAAYRGVGGSKLFMCHSVASHRVCRVTDTWHNCTGAVAICSHVVVCGWPMGPTKFLWFAFCLQAVLHPAESEALSR